MISLIPLPYKILAGVFAIIGFFSGGYFYGRKAESHAMQIIIDQMRLSHDAEIQDAQFKVIKMSADNDTLKIQLGVQHAQANKALNILMSNAVSGVQLPSCEGLSISSSSEAHPTSGSSSAIETNRVLLTEAERILDEDRLRTKAIIGEAEQELIECRVSKEWARSQAQ